MRPSRGPSAFGSLRSARCASAVSVGRSTHTRPPERPCSAAPTRAADFAGLDIWNRIFGALAPDLASDSHSPPRALTERIAAGQLGTKSGSGFFDYTAEGELARRQTERDAGYAAVAKAFHCAQK